MELAGKRLRHLESGCLHVAGDWFCSGMEVACHEYGLSFRFAFHWRLCTLFDLELWKVIMIFSLFEIVGPLAQAEVTETGDPFRVLVLLRALVAAVAFSILGVIVLGVATWVLSRSLPFSMRKEIEEDQNVSLGIIIGSLILGMSIIIAASIMG